MGVRYVVKFNIYLQRALSSVFYRKVGKLKKDINVLCHVQYKLYIIFNLITQICRVRTWLLKRYGILPIADFNLLRMFLNQNRTGL